MCATILVLLIASSCSGNPFSSESKDPLSDPGNLLLLANNLNGLKEGGENEAEIENPDFTDALNATLGQDYVIFAANDLGMHCLNPEYDTAVILPPYNNLQAQVIKRGNPPELITENVSLNYSIENNTTSLNKRDYGSFWDFVSDLFGTNLADDTGLTGNGLSGTLELSGGIFKAEGIPVTPVGDDGVWNPYQVAMVTVKDLSGTTLAETKTTIPTSDEINCGKCHTDNANPFQDILNKHDANVGTSPALDSQKPVLCASCHGSPALGGTYATNRNGATTYLSEAIHGSHAARSATCYDCHPGASTKCNRSTAHTADDGNCTACHGSMANVAGTIASGRTPWASEPACSQCHTGSGSTLTEIGSSTSSSIAEVDTSGTLFRNATGHGGVLCTSCHGSPHAMVPTSEASDNYQNLHYQGSSFVMGDCRTCHSNSRGPSGEEENEFYEEHGGSSPEKRNACHVCHTGISGSTSEWPHSYQWKSRSR